MTTEPFELTPSPADPQPVRVYMLDDCTWWAGYSLQQCIEQAISEEWRDQHSIHNPRELSAEDMEQLKFLDDPDCDEAEERSFAAELQRRIDAGEQFPQFFASTEY